MADKIISRAQAKAQGLKRYFTGKPCKWGHIVERFVDGNCVQCRYDQNEKWRRRNLDKKRELERDWRKRNAAKVNKRGREYQREWRLRNIEAARERDRAYYKANPERGREATNRWRDKNREAARAANSQWYKDNPDKRRALGKRKYQNNGERIKARNTEWRNANPEVISARDNRRRARILNAPGRHTGADLVAILKAQNHQCAYCKSNLRKVRKHLDHIVPLSRGGSNDKANLQYTCEPCNLSKKDKDPLDFARSRGLLL